MAEELRGRVVAIMAADGVDGGQVERLREELRGNGAHVHVIAPICEDIAALDGRPLHVDAAIGEVATTYYDALVLCGGAGAVDTLSADKNACALLARFVEANRVVGALEGGVALLACGGLLKGHQVSAPPGLESFVRDAGGMLSQAPVAVDGPFVTCANADDLMVFVTRFGEEVREWRARDLVDEQSAQSFPASDAPSSQGAAI